MHLHLWARKNERSLASMMINLPICNVTECRKYLQLLPSPAFYSVSILSVNYDDISLLHNTLWEISISKNCNIEFKK